MTDTGAFAQGSYRLLVNAGLCLHGLCQRSLSLSQHVCVSHMSLQVAERSSTSRTQAELPPEVYPPWWGDGSRRVLPIDKVAAPQREPSVQDSAVENSPKALNSFMVGQPPSLAKDKKLLGSSLPSASGPCTGSHSKPRGGVQRRRESVHSKPKNHLKTGSVSSGPSKPGSGMILCSPSCHLCELNVHKQHCDVNSPQHPMHHESQSGLCLRL
jgi:hypothetical protein